MRVKIISAVFGSRGGSVSSLRARCPFCRTWTAVALGPGYECHACGRTFGAGLVRVPRAWGTGGEAMADGAFLDLPYPEAGVVEKDTLDEQSATLASLLPERPLVLGGCCCAHIGAVRGLAERVDRLAVVWLDAHGDLNTPETSPSGNLWGMPLRMLLDDGIASPDHVALVGARNLDAGETEFLERAGIDDSAERALAGVDGAYVALDLDVLDPSEAAVFVPEPDGPNADDVEGVLRDVASRTVVLGAGVTGQLRDERNLQVATRLLTAVGLESASAGEHDPA